MNYNLPPMPEPYHGFYATPMYSPDQMRAYARQALAQPAASGEPVAVIERDGVLWLNTNPNRMPIGTRIYATAQPAPARVPLTDEQVFRSDAIMKVNAHAGLAMRWLMELTRAIEAAHGIGAPDAQKGAPP